MSRFLLLVALTVPLTACGSDEADEPASLAEAADAIEPMPPASEAPSAPPSVSGATIVDRIAEAGNLATLNRLLQESGVADDLAAEGPFTVFAPSDEAFAAAGELPTDPALVRQLVLNHALPFRVTAIDMDFEQTVETIGGASISIAPGSPPAISSASSRAQIVTPDLDAANGVVHILDAVLR